LEHSASKCADRMFKSRSDERVTRSQAKGVISAFLKSTASRQLSEDVSHKLLIVRKFLSRIPSGKEKVDEGCFHMHVVECKVGLTAAELGDAETAITRRLSAYVLGAHVMEYMGVMLAFSKFIVPQFTPLKWDLPHVFVTVLVRMLVFDPTNCDLLCLYFSLILFHSFLWIELMTFVLWLNRWTSLQGSKGSRPFVGVWCLQCDHPKERKIE